MTVTEVKSLYRSIDTEALYRHTVTVFHIWLPLGSERPPKFLF